MNREKCEHFERCGKTGHYVDPKQRRWTRCPCLESELAARQLGQMFHPNPKTQTPLIGALGKNLRLEGHVEDVRQHVAGALLDLSKRKGTWATLDSYRLLDIFLGHDAEYQTQGDILDKDLLILLLGFGDPRNQYLPELINQALARRELNRKPTWVVMGIGLERVAAKYNKDLEDRLMTFQRSATK